MSKPKLYYFFFFLGILVVCSIFQKQSFFQNPKTTFFTSFPWVREVRVIAETWSEQLFSFIRFPSRQANISILEETAAGIFQTEFEDLIATTDSLRRLRIQNLYPVAFLLRSGGTGSQESWILYSETDVAVNAFVVSVQQKTLVGRVLEMNGNWITAIPVWNENFSCQVRVKSGNGTVQDLAYLENGKILNFNPSFQFQEGDEVFLSDYEQGGFSLQRYGWNRIGTIGHLLSEDIVEYYEIVFTKDREAFLDERYFLVVQ